jgi:hypothetical protein
MLQRIEQILKRGEAEGLMTRANARLLAMALALVA